MKKASKLTVVFIMILSILNVQYLQAKTPLFSIVLEQDPPMEELQKAYDELMYNLNVVWDQKDKDFHRTITENFRKKAQALYEDGLTKDILFDFIALNIKDDKVRADFQKVIADDMLNELDNEASMNYVLAHVDLTQQEGSAFGSVGSILGAATLIGLIALALSSCYEECYYGYCETVCFY